jgi:hypothetical protein
LRACVVSRLSGSGGARVVGAVELDRLPFGAGATTESTRSQPSHRLTLAAAPHPALAPLALLPLTPALLLLQEAELAETLAKQAASDLYNAAMGAINKTIATAEACVPPLPERAREGGG